MTAADVAFQEDLASCMREHGWDPTLLDTGVYDYVYTEEQSDIFSEERDLCLDQIGIPDYNFSEADWRDLYEFYLGTIDCLRNEGVEIDAPPSYQQWEDSGRSWTPYETISPDAYGEEFNRLIEVCPQTPVG